MGKFASLILTLSFPFSLFFFSGPPDRRSDRRLGHRRLLEDSLAAGIIDPLLSTRDEHGQVGQVSGGAPSVRCLLLLV